MKNITGYVVGLIFVLSSISAENTAIKTSPSVADNNFACFSNKYVRGCTRAYLSKDKKRVTVAATIRNSATHPVFVALLSTCYHDWNDHCGQEKSDKPKYSFPNAEVLTDGKSLRATSTRGVTTYFRRWIDRDKANINNMTVLDPNGKMTITYLFLSDKPIESNMYDFTSEAVMYVPSASDPKKFTKRKFTISGTDVFFPIQ